MARKTLSIPPEVKESIKNHLKAKCQEALYGYHSSSEEEDSLTGDLGATLRIRDKRVTVQNQEVGKEGTWMWSMDYIKFRGRGQNATESILGADGVFELTLNAGGFQERKTILFQTKKDWDYDQNVMLQALKLSNWREASFILNFTENIYETFDIDSAISARGKKPTTPGKTLEDFLGIDFLDCYVGDVDLRYDSKSRILSWRTIDNEFVATKFSIPQKFSLNIKAPGSKSTNKIISNSEVFKHRMDAKPEEILSIEHGFTEAQLKDARRKKARIFHLDAAGSKGILIDEINTLRMQEINQAFDILRRKI